MSITVDQISRQFGNTVALHPSSLDIKEGELVGLLGPSGSGKTTLLRIIAGLETPSAGRILFSGRDVTNLHPRNRRVGFVFQHYALFRHMTVFDNIAFGLKANAHRLSLGRQEITERVNELLGQIQLEAYAKRLPAQLSGGQQQRVALARALAVRPEVLLMDEPFGALDAKVRVELRRWLRHLHEQLGFTCVFVTHDQDEALELSDRVAVMSQGRVEQIAAPAQLYREPANRFVFDFLGTTNSFKGEVRDEQLYLGEQGTLRLPKVANGAAELVTRPHEISLSHSPSDSATLPAQVSAIAPIGAVVEVELQPFWEAPNLHVTLSPRDFEQASFAVGDTLYLHPHRLMLVDPHSTALTPVS
ncbi:sulfate/molybdate ABC transporter ATP-binding protein [Carnimonas nigrificans]|uniref:sulfate/molybdate ABC transporter ATP-binding protein n=1 Tax=Carnimonas nigrificans TaxID=64323 RepID=UPI00046EEB1B|nr:TOBE-like domain-containing protein [Carnimonas nigrificans]